MNTEILVDRLSYLNTKENLTIDEAAKYTGISVSTLHKYCSRGIIPHSKPEGRWVFFKRTDLDAWMSSRRVESQKGLYQMAVNQKQA